MLEFKRKTKIAVESLASEIGKTSRTFFRIDSIHEARRFVSTRSLCMCGDAGAKKASCGKTEKS
jgi:hypothetical protein